MHWGLGVDVLDHHTQVILMDNGGGDFPANNAAKNGIATHK
jgi:hypothetical protein